VGTSKLSKPIEPKRRRAAIQMWVARLLVQIAEASLFAFLLLWFRSIDPTFEENRIATIFTAVLCCAVIIALVVGRWSDRHDQPLTPLVYAALAAATGLGIMAIATDISLAIVGYALFGMAGSVFLAIHSAQTLRVLPNPGRRGRDLGIFNLTNTVPSIVMPWLTLALVPVYGFDALFIVLGLLALCAAMLLLRRPIQA
jgi:MFS family permease